VGQPSGSKVFKRGTRINSVSSTYVLDEVQLIQRPDDTFQAVFMSGGKIKAYMALQVAEAQKG
jgi:hypothetical protein